MEPFRGWMHSWVCRAKGRYNLVRNIKKQYDQRVEYLPLGTNQKVLIDVRGPNVSYAELKALRKNIMNSTENGIKVIFKKRQEESILWLDSK